MIDLLKELEDKWQEPRDLWSPKRWKQAALLAADACTQLESAYTELTQSKEKIISLQEELITRLQNDLKKSDTINTRLNEWIEKKLTKRPVGRPPKPKPESLLPHQYLENLANLASLAFPRVKRRGNQKYSKRDKEILVATVDSKKRELGLKTDRDALRHLYYETKGVRRESQVISNAKLLNRFRKEISAPEKID